MDPRVLEGTKLEIINFASFGGYGQRNKGEEKKNEKNSFHKNKISHLCPESN
jgi:hypothetical protein